MDRSPTASAMLLTAKQAAATCSKSVRTWRSWDAAGKVPRAIRIGRSTLWRLEDLRSWVELGCPPRREFEARLPQGGGQ
jgi:predicted DNA-binding transcriptional regulator AlpA